LPTPPDAAARVQLVWFPLGTPPSLNIELRGFVDAR
jgi:hypothetical protein